MQEQKEKAEIERIIGVTEDFWQTCPTEIGFSRKAGYFFYYATDRHIDGLKVCRTAREFARRTFYEMIAARGGRGPHENSLTGAQKQEIRSRYQPYLDALPEYRPLFEEELERF